MGPTSSSQSSRKVHRRSVFYLSGFDPKGAAHYHAMYVKEAAKQATVSGIDMKVGPRRKTETGNACWKITAQTDEGAVETHYEFLRWDDIVRQHWSRNQLQLAWDIVTTTCLNLRHGSLWRMLKLAWPPVVALFAPFLLLCTVLLGVPLLSLLVFQVVPSTWGSWTTVALAFGITVMWVRLGLWLETKYSMLWLMRSYAFTARQAIGEVPELDLRLDQHAITLVNRLTANVDDEILVVGHSSGTMMAISTLARALRRDPKASHGGPVLSLLTLGHCVPMLGCLPQAVAFREDLKLLAMTNCLDWVDFTAPPDGCCFALVDPLLACGVTLTARMEDRPKLLSPRFAEMFETANYAEIRRDKFRVHFQYLMASQKSVSYDYFAMTAGSSTLGGRFKTEKSIKGYSEFQIFGPKL